MNRGTSGLIQHILRGLVSPQSSIVLYKSHPKVFSFIRLNICYVAKLSDVTVRGIKRKNDLKENANKTSDIPK